MSDASPARASVEPAERPTADVSPPETVVTATRYPRPIRDVPSTIVVLPREEIDRSPALTLDSLVRSVPGVATFRRNSSLVADPTAQGVNLRGVGPSGVSRALVLLDGIPVSEPFGNWVFWRSVPQIGIERIEVAPGAGSALYGTSALGGIVHLVSREPRPMSLDAEAIAGSFTTAEFAARAAHAWENVGVSLEGEWLRTDGFRIVAQNIAGQVDQRARSGHGAAAARLTARPRAGSRLDIRAAWFDQDQNGGTRFTNSRARLLSGSARWQEEVGSGVVDVSAWVRSAEFRQQRARISADRSTEALAAEQRVPSEDLGAAAVWVGPGLGSHTPSAGVDLRAGRGTSFEDIFPATPSPSSIVSRSAGGTQQFGGAFVQDSFSPTSALQIVATLRYDAWRHVEGHRSIEREDGSISPETFPDRFEQRLSPRLGALYRPTDWFAVRGSGGSGFRAPTLNELYRPFQVGTVLTLANEDLRAEELWGAEAGLEVSPGPGFVARVTGFGNLLQNAVTNATLEVPIDGASRQRQNLGTARVMGVESSVDARLARVLTVLVAYTWVDARVAEAPGNESLEGKRLPQDPEHRAFASVTFDDPALLTATAQVRVVGPQYEDDLNELPMAGYALVDVSASRKIAWGLEVFAAVENLLDRRYLVGRAGIDTLGQPLTIRAGVRFRSGP